jgi:hypothetical protein
MKIIQSALLVLLTYALAGLGVPAGFAQAKAASSSTAKKKSPTTTTGKPAVKGRAASSSAGKAKDSTTNKSSSNASAKSGKSSGRASGKSSRRTRRQPGQKAPTNDRISEIQTALAKDGSFQASHGLNPSGKLDAPTLQRLGLGSQTAGIAAPTPPPGATSRLTSSNNPPAGTTDSPRRP